MKPYSITAPEEIAKEYGGDKRKIQQAAAQGLIDPTSAVLAGMFIDRIRNAAQAEQAPQPTVAEQVMNPQPQIPSAGLAAAPQAAQMQQPMPPRMGQPAPPRMPQPAPPQMAQQPPMPPQQPMGMAMGGGLDSIDFVEQAYAPGGLVSFDAGGGYGETMQQLRTQLGAARTQAQRDQIQATMNQLRAQYERPSFVSNMSRGPQREGLAGVDLGDSLDVGMESFADTQRAVNPYGPEGRIDPSRFDTGTLTEEEAMRIAEESRDSGLDALSTGMVGGRSRAAGAGEGVGVSGVLQQAAEGLAGLTSSEAPRGRRAAQQGTGVEGTGDSFLERLANFRGFDDEGMTLREKISDPGRYLRDESVLGRMFRDEQTPDAYTGATMPAPETETRPQRDTMVGDGAMRDMGQSPFGLEQQFDRADTTPAAGTVTDQIAAQQDTTAPATEPSLTDDFNAFQERMQGIMPKNEYGEYRQKFEQMMADAKGTMERGRKDAFSMALLQAGLGMLGQQGGQTALQALGKAALPATKQYMDTVKDLKKDERELFKLGLSLERMDTQERNATFRTMANLFGQERAREATLEAARINSEKTTGEERMIDNIYIPRAKELFPNLSPAAQAQKAASMYFEDKGQAALAGVGQRAGAAETGARETALEFADQATSVGGSQYREYRRIMREQGADAAQQFKNRIAQDRLAFLTGASGGNAGQSGGNDPLGLR